MCGRTIFILGMDRFGSGIESTMFTIAKHLARDNQVFYIENPYTWKSFIVRNEKEAIERRRAFFSFGSDKVMNTGCPNLKVLVAPPLVSINWLPEGKVYRFLLRINEKIILHRIRQIIRNHRVRNYIFINSFNFYYPGIGHLLSPDLLVYHCVDPIVFPVDKKHGLVSEKKIIEKSDLVICTSRRLYDEKVKLNSNTHFIPNAADIAHSSKALQPGLPVHECLSGISRPIVGYFGNIERRLDYDLLAEVIPANPMLNFVFTGPVSREFVPAWFYKQPNIHLTGPVPYEDMPRVLKGFDLAMIPFKKDEVSATIFPLKLFEYLGSGTPVVATDFNPDLADFTGSAVAYCSSADSFCDAIIRGLGTDNRRLREERIAIARRNTWDKRGDEFAALIDKYSLKDSREQFVAKNVMQP
jgi:teichuronic acid biosynthesis glycosyltransferase TuaH